MSNPSKKALAQALLERHGQTYAEELHISLARNTPSPLFKMLVASLLYSARISADAATEAAKALYDRGWTTPAKMAKATWRQRTDVLNHHGYARYDESTSRMLEDTSKHLLDEYDGDLRNLREEANHDPAEERRHLKAFKGIGDVGADIFLREAQVAWDELHPFADKRALQAAQELKLGKTPKDLAELVKKSDYPRLVAALVRTQLAKDFDDVRDAAK